VVAVEGVGRGWGRGGAGGGFHQFVEGVGRGGGLVHGVVVGLESHLAPIGPGTFHARVVGKGAQEGVVGWGEVLIDGELGSDTVGGEVVGGRECCTFVFENKATEVFRVKFHDDWADVGILLGGDRKGAREGEMEYRHVVRRQVVVLLGRIDDGNDDLLIDDVEDLGSRGFGVNGQAVDTNRVGAGGLL
jgi:hypothetical protein